LAIDLVHPRASENAAANTGERPLGAAPWSPALDSEPAYTIAPYTFATHWGNCHISNQLFELDWSLTGGIHVDMFGVPPHCLVRLASSGDKEVPPIPESHLQSIRDSVRHGGFYNKEQLFVPLSVVLEDGREMTGLWIRYDNGCVTPVFLGRENESIQCSRFGIGPEAQNNPAGLSRETLGESPLETRSTSSDIFDGGYQGLEGLVSLDGDVASRANSVISVPQYRFELIVIGSFPAMNER